MDYDDNDFQSQNLQLTGEGSSKFPPVLQPYALPKFDFDDNLHGSLRFDNLVETEVFLGIGSNEDSQWIEDFSRGSGGIQFTSSAAESCSIPLRNNVWSEATSSESVEMLLKSVGQEELILAQTRTKESESCDELGCIIKQMEPNLKQNTNKETSVEDLTNIQPAMLPVQFPVDDDGDRQLSQNENISYSGGDASGEKGLGNITANSVEVKSPIGGRSPFIDNCDDNGGNEMQVDNAVNESLDDRMQEISALRTEVDNVATTSLNITQGDVGIDNKDALDNVTETADEELVSSGTDKGEHHEKEMTEGDGFCAHVPNAEFIDSRVSHMDSRSPLEYVKDECANQTNLCNVGEPCATPKEDYGIETGHQLSIDTHEESLVIIEDDSSDHRREIEDSNGSNLDNGIVIKDVSFPLSIEDNKASENKVDGKSSSYAAVNCSSSELCEETNADDHVPSSMMVENMQMCEKDVSGQHDVIVGKKNVEQSSVDCDVDGVNDQHVFMSSFGKGDREVVVSKSEPDSFGGSESANVKVEASPLSSVLTLSDTEKEIAAKTCVEASLSLEVAPEVTSGANSVSETEQVSPVAAGQILGKSDNQLAVDACDAQNQIESHSLVIGKVSEECIKDKDATLPMYDSTADTRGSVQEQIKGKGNDVKEHVNVSDQTMNVEMPGLVPSTMTDAVQDVGHNVEKEVVKASNDIRVEQIAVPGADVEHVGCADHDKPASGSPTIIRSARSYDERNKEGINAIPNQITSVSADKKQSASMYWNKTDPSKDDGSFSFEVNPLAVSPRKNSRKRHASLTVEASRASPIVDASTSSGLGELDLKVAPDVSHGSPKGADVAIVLSGSKGNTERKARRASGKAPAKESAKKRNTAKTASGKSDREDKMTGVSLSPSSVSQPVQSNEIQRIGNLDSNIITPFALATSTAGLPDLNSSFSPSGVFHQPFTDLQQVQLRAQIFVYGALIQGTVPDEAYIISAFGGPDGGRSMWENSWRLCIERLHGHKSHLNTPETPLQSRSGARPPEPSIKHSAVQSKVVSSPIGWGSSKSIPAIASPIMPFSSPLWTMPTPGGTLQPSTTPMGPVVDFQRLLSPLHAHQSSGIRNFVGHSPSWLSQAPYATPWTASQNSALDTSCRFSVQFPVTETVQLTPVKETSVHHSSAMRPAGPPAQSAGSSNVIAGSPPMLSAKMVTASGTQPSIDPKPRKRKKNSVSDNTLQNALPPQSQKESVIAPAVASPLYTSVAFTSPVVFDSKGPAEIPVTPTTPMPADSWKGDQTSKQMAILSEETLGKIKDAKVQAEEAAASAASAVTHSQQVWDQLEKQKNVGLLPPDVEAQLASAAVAVAAAAAVARAAAAAANVASNAALQAKLIAEEAVASTNMSQSNAISFPDGMRNLGKFTPASILKGDGTSSSTSIMGVARETARKKVEATTAAAKRAENMDAVVKAAELAAEAVSQAGKIVAMGDPMPLSELVAAGPEGYWKAALPEVILRSNGTDSENININSGREGKSSFTRLKEVPLEKRDNHIASLGKPPAPIESFGGGQDRLIEGLPGYGVMTLKESRVQKRRRASSDLTKTFGMVPDSENGARTSIAQNEPEKEETLKENHMKEHSLVEVYKDGSGIKAAWFPAKVIGLKDGKAYVEFTELALGEEKLKEWVPLEGNGDEAPKIRTARPATNVIPFEGTRKRRRAAMADHVWSVGDRVDAWIEDSWREGVVTEKNKKDESLLTVNFPARGEILVIPSALLHPSCVWKDGAWVEWSSSGESSRPAGDTPKEKRARVRSPEAEAKGKDKALGRVDALESNKSDHPPLLALSIDEKQFNIGKSSRTDTMRMPRTGLQKDRPRVIFGVPKPGKKQKFMEVSKHYIGDRSGQMSEAKEPLKFTKYLMPQGPGSSRAWKSSTKTETNEKRAAVSRPAKVFKSGRSQNVSGRTVQKDNSSNAAASDSDSKDALNEAENFNAMAFQPSYTPSMSLSARAPHSNTVSSKRTERVSKGRLAPAPKLEQGKTSIDHSAGSASDSLEPRRSNRRIQPTSRLLEGLQTSSLLVSKIPSLSHDKSHRSKNAPRGNNKV